MKIPKNIKKSLSPALLTYSKQEAGDKLAFIAKYYPNSHVHIDVMDGKFVPARCWCQAKSFQTLDLPQSFEVHLMVKEPRKYLAAWKKAGATRAIFHIEATEDPRGVIVAIRKYGMEACVALNPATALSKIALILPLVDAILVMGVVPGYAGQRFIPSTITKIRRAAALRPKKLIIIDGGVTLHNAPSLLKAGASQLVSTTAVYGKDFSPRH